VVHIQQEQWWKRAKCLTCDPELFYPQKGQTGEDAKEVCRRCPVRAECLNAALEGRERFGIWGGMTERERRRYRRAQTNGVAA
jgi:WhiB family redox-sensing transcriptional regulator